MGDLLSSRKQVIHARVTPVAVDGYGALTTFLATHAMFVGDINVTPLDITAVDRNNIQQFFGSQGTINVKESGKISFKTEWAGSGTPGTAPRNSALFLACNFNEVIMGAAYTGTAVTGSLTTIQFPVGASAVDDFYLGMEVRITAGTGNGSYARIVGYNGATRTATVSTPFSAAISATSVFNVRPNVRYLPHSVLSTNGAADICIRYNRDGVEHIFLGGRGNVKLSADANKIAYLEWEFTGLIGTIADVAPGLADFTGIPPGLGVMSTTVDNFNLHGLIKPNAVGASIQLDMANKVVYPDLFNQDAVLITDRKAMLKAKVLAVKTVVKDWWTATRNSVEGVFSMSLGKTPGNISSVVAVGAQPTTITYGDIEDITTHDVDLMLKPVRAGNNEVIFIFD